MEGNQLNPDLRTEVDYSKNAGLTWTPVYLGPNKGSATVPAGDFAASSQARLRVRANDGFNETTAMSAGFTSVGAPPTVTILSPSAGTQITTDTAINLRGSAFDDSDNQLSGTQLKWSAGVKGLGSGAVVTARYLPPGSDPITLTATDSLGRKSTAHVTLDVAAAAPSVVPLTLLNGWTNAPYRTADAGVSEANGVVSFQGAIDTTGSDAVPFIFLLRSDRRRTYTSRSICAVRRTDDCRSTRTERSRLKPKADVSNAQCFTSLDGASFVQRSSGSLR